MSPSFRKFLASHDRHYRPGLPGSTDEVEYLPHRRAPACGPGSAGPNWPRLLLQLGNAVLMLLILLFLVRAAIAS